MEIQEIPIKDSERKEIPTDNFGFGRIATDRMFTQYYSPEEGWHDATIGSYRELSFDPRAAVLHYGQEIFEGTKAYRRPDGYINLFRTWENMKRFNDSARRMAMPVVDEEEHMQAIVQLIALENDWVPNLPGTSLYIRPVMLGIDAALGVHSSKTYLHYVILSPVDTYFPEGFNPVSVYIEPEYRRAVRGGTGSAKTGGNYAASLLVGQKAKAKGYSQVLWLDAVEGRYVEEVGAMNICFVYDNKRIVTPPLTGSILPGVTRDSVITLGRDLGYEVEEAMIDVYEMIDDLESGKITEVFGCGTAAVIAPVGKLGYKDEEIIINNFECGPVAVHLFKELTDIQYGRKPDRFNWTYTIETNGHHS
ncbi:MAG: branched-chain amino acid aminotransferase [Candidatus Promineifilaceae bacterium]